nr:HEPN domain-containing protein [Actinomyces wuliandei]
MHGAAGNREITLLGCSPLRSKRTFLARVDSPDTQAIVVDAALVGTHVSSWDDAVFSAAEMSVEDMVSWAGTSALKCTLGCDGGKLDGTGSISVSPVEEKSVACDGTTFCLLRQYTAPFMDWRKGEAIGRIRNLVSMRVVPESPFSLKSVLEKVSLVQYLVALATHQAAGVLWVRLEPTDSEIGSLSGRSRSRRGVDLLYAPFAVGAHDSKAVDAWRILFSCDSLPFEEILPRWCEVRERLLPAINMIMGLRYGSTSFVENRLLTAVGAAEALHRRLGIEEKPFPDDEFKKVRSALLKQMPEEYRRIFKSEIRNDLTLRDRLQQLAGRLDPGVVDLLVPDVGHWAGRAVRARNDLAHEGSTPKHSLEELAAVVDVTTVVVLLNVLHELGLPAERQREIVRYHPAISAAAERARRCLVPPEGQTWA